MASPVDYDFVDQVLEDHHCTICSNILTDPVLTGCCGKLFCDGCLQKQKTCPHCKEDDFKNMVDLRVKRLAIDGFKIYCPNRSKGCDNITTINKHLEKCLFVEVSCTKKCGERMLRQELQDHEDNKCPNRLVQCQYCSTEGMHKEITHLDKCLLFPISCPNNCGHENMQWQNLAGHQKVCPLEPVKCPFFEAGCTEMIVRKDLAEHKASNTEHHLELVMTETVTLKQKANKFEQEATAEIEAVEQKVNQLQQLSLKFDGLAFCVTKQLGTIDSNPQTQAAIKNIKRFLRLGLATMTTMLAPGDTRYYLPLVQESEYRARSASFYIKPGYKMHVVFGRHDHCAVLLEEGEHDHQLKWPMSEIEIKVSTKENIILCSEIICTRCGHTVNRLTVGEKLGITLHHGRGKALRNFVFLTVKKHFCKTRT